jgi:hypothetical protein
VLEAGTAFGSQVFTDNGSVVTSIVWSVFAKQSQPSAVTLRYSRNVHVHGQGQRDTAGSDAISLEALELVQRLVEAPLHRGLVAGELGEGVRAVAIPYEGQTERRRIRIPHISVGFLNEYARLHSAQSPKPPEEGSDPVREEALKLTDGLQLSPQASGELP